MLAKEIKKSLFSDANRDNIQLKKLADEFQLQQQQQQSNGPIDDTPLSIDDHGPQQQQQQHSQISESSPASQQPQTEQHYESKYDWQDWLL